MYLVFCLSIFLFHPLIYFCVASYATLLTVRTCMNCMFRSICTLFFLLLYISCIYVVYTTGYVGVNEKVAFHSGFVFSFGFYIWTFNDRSLAVSKIGYAHKHAHELSTAKIDYTPVQKNMKNNNSKFFFLSFTLKSVCILFHLTLFLCQNTYFFFFECTIFIQCSIAMILFFFYLANIHRRLWCEWKKPEEVLSVRIILSNKIHISMLLPLMMMFSLAI